MRTRRAISLLMPESTVPQFDKRPLIIAAARWVGLGRLVRPDLLR